MVPSRHIETPVTPSMNHASNYLNLRGTLNADRGAMLEKVRAGLRGDAELKPEYFRAL